MFSPNSFYDYLRYYFSTTKKDIAIRTFNKPGDNNLLNMDGIVSNKLTPYLFPRSNSEIKQYALNIQPILFAGYCECFDQDPINVENYYQASHSNINSLGNDENKHLNIMAIKQRIADKKTILQQIDNPIDFLIHHSAGIHNPIVCHSERQSEDVRLLSDNHFIPVHYWYHAYISLYWYQHYKYLQPNTKITPHRFGTYIRDASGTRTYRIDLIDKLQSINSNVYFAFNEPFISQIKEQNKANLLSKWDINRESISSDNSAIINWTDTEMFDIQLIPETLFDTTKTHLTEKSLKPIAMGQPFIIIGCPNSLAYLRSYGFKTFGSLWDESYDYEESPTVRFKKIINLIHNIANLSSAEYQKMATEAKKIALYNREYFYSEKFELLLFNELHNELNRAFEVRDEMYHKMPGGTYFHTMNKSHNKGILTDMSYQNIRTLMAYINTHHKNIATQIIKKYNHLL